MRIAIDTNILIAALADPSGTSADIVNAWVDGRMEVVASEATIREAELVLGGGWLARLGAFGGGERRSSPPAPRPGAAAAIPAIAMPDTTPTPAKTAAPASSGTSAIATNTTGTARHHDTAFPGIHQPPLPVARRTPPPWAHPTPPPAAPPAAIAAPVSPSGGAPSARARPAAKAGTAKPIA